MAYNIDLAIAGFVVLLVLLLYLKIQYRGHDTVTIRHIGKLVFFMLLADTFDIITGLTITYATSVPLWLNYVLNVAFFDLNGICIYLFPVYIRYIINQKTDVMDIISDILLGVYIVMCTTSPFTKLIFYFDENLLYSHGMLYFCNYAIPMLFFAYAFIKLFANYKKFEKKRRFSVIGFMVIATSGPILQMTIPGNHLVDYFVLSIAAFVIIFGIETPDYIRLQEVLEELEKHKESLEIAKRIEENKNKTIQSMTKTATWSLQVDKQYNPTKKYWSDEFFWLLGYDRAELGDKENDLWDNSLHPDESQTVLADFMKGLRGEAEFLSEYRLRGKDGVYKWYRGNGERVVNSDGTVEFHGIIQDIDEEKIKEELTAQRLAVVEELEKSQIALKEAVIKAETADRAKSDFLANMSHEIRTPINAVLGMNELILRESQDESIRSYASNVSDAGNALLALINDILDFSKIEAGQMELVPGEYKLSDLLREVGNMIGIRCSEKGLRFVIDNNPGIPNLLYGDEIRIRQILINLLNNALKYTEEGSVTLKVEYEKRDDDRIILVMSAIDTGIGIKSEDLPLLFESFKRIDLEKNRKREGTGLGLNITKSFVTLMGGSIEVESEYGHGSTFKVYIPQEVRGKEEIGNYDPTAQSAPRKAYKPSLYAPNANVLVVDDVPMNLRVVRGLLKQTGIKVDMAESGAECLEKIKQNEYDVILLDHMMPEMDGLETITRLKEDKTHPNQETPIIMLTANAIIGAREEYLQMGFRDYLSKPVKGEELETMLSRYIDLSKQN
ncbi:MAG: response regulator [Lachnospiraceae bacterium]|nr:response regulator [Candidatus Merdinaster equi]